MHSSVRLNRRDFMVGTSAALTAGLMSIGQAAQAEKPLKVIGFVKPFQKLSYAEIADISAEIGWDGIECPVRKGGTIEPPAVEDELPKMVQALRTNNLELPVIATDVEDAGDEVSQRVLRTASKLGIGQYRMKHYYYDLEKTIAPQLENFRAKIRDLAQLNQELNVQGTIQNHSGRNYVGAPVWDLWELMRGLNSKEVAVYFDIGHATLEGGYSWPIQARLIEPILAVVSVKDFLWKKQAAAANRQTGWRAEWCPVGEGMVDGGFFDWLKKTEFAGPISQHFEYSMGSGREMIAAMKKDLAMVKAWLSA